MLLLVCLVNLRDSMFWARVFIACAVVRDYYLVILTSVCTGSKSSESAKRRTAEVLRVRILGPISTSM